MWQTASKDFSLAKKALARTEYANVVDKENHLIKRELKYIDTWLERYAPPEVKFTLLAAVPPKQQFTPKQVKALALLADKLDSDSGKISPEWMKVQLYAVKDECGINPKDLFIGLYRLLIGRDSGPRAAFFLASLDRDWLKDRLRFIR